MIDLTALIIFIICILLYNIIYYYETVISRRLTARRLLDIYREAWIEKQIKENNVIIIVQTCRNIIMVCSFLASSLIVFISLLLNKILVFHGDSVKDIFSLHDEPWIMWKLYVLTFFLSGCTLKLLNSIRYLLRFNIVVGTDFKVIEKYEGVEGLKQVAENIKKSADGFAIAIRGLYYSLAVVLWFFNTHLFIMATIFLTVLLIFYQDFRRI